MSAARHQRRIRAQWLLALALVPLLLIGAAFDGAWAWIHSHGHAGGHVHLLAGEFEGAAFERWRAFEHPAEHSREHEEHEHERLDLDHEGQGGLLIDLPEGLVTSAGGTPLRPSPSPRAEVVLQHWAVRPAAVLLPPGAFRAAWPPRWEGRSAVAVLLRSSHAILI